MKSLILTSLFILSLPLFASRKLPAKLKYHWTEKTVFFGVNKAWDYKKQEHTTLTYLARDEVFNYDEFSEEKYWEGLKKARTLGLKFAGITGWKIDKKSIEIRGPNKPPNKSGPKSVNCGRSPNRTREISTKYKYCKI